MSGPEVITFGCRLNTYESEVMRAYAGSAGLNDAVIVNTCAVTGEAERQARQAIRKARRQHPNARIIVTGCAAQVNPDAYAAMPEVDRVLGNLEKLRPESWTGTSQARVAVADIMQVRETAHHLVEGFEGRARAFLQMQQGCDHRCTFCIIPFGRGNSRSVPLGDLVAQAAALVDAGYREIVLTGVDLTAYGADLPGSPSLAGTIRRLLALVPELPRLRLSSIDVAEAGEEMLRLIAEEAQLMPHLHLSLQSGDDLILKRMKRRHSRAQAVAFCAEARRRRPDLVFGADLIAGFPTESDEAFQASLALVEDCGLTWLHVFPYSPRPGTPAARMPQVPGAVRKRRAANLRAAGARAAGRWLSSRVGGHAAVLVEDGTSARSEHFAPVEMAAALPAGTMARARITAALPDRLIGEIAS